mmetsp:Transcript_90483/g.251518  ORF Transcript_90483/g.251518 Transcript_90483/m.251518 type:complete len:293 (-) Transcript_90483:173-1051(-)
MHPRTSLAMASPLASPNFWISSSACVAASCALSRLLLKKCAQAASTSILPSSFSIRASWQIATASLTTFMPSSNLPNTRCTWARMCIESSTSALSPIFLANATASFAASNARSLSFADFLAPAGSSALSTSSTSAVRISSCTMPGRSPISWVSDLAVRAASRHACQVLLSACTLASMCKALASPFALRPSLKIARASSAHSKASLDCPIKLWMLLAASRAIASSLLSPSFTASSLALLTASRASAFSPLDMCTSMRISCAFACSCPALSSCSKIRTAQSAACKSLSGCCLRK